MQAEALEVIERVAERVNLQFAAVAGSGIDLADRREVAKPAARASAIRSRRSRALRAAGDILRK